MFMTRVCQVVHIELTVPICHHRLMVISPGLCASHGLDGMHTNYWFQSTVMSLRTGNGLATIVYHITIILDESFHQFFVCHEYRSVLMPYGKVDAARLVLECLKVLGTMGAINLMTVRVVIDIPPVTYLCRGGTFRKRFRKGF